MFLYQELLATGWSLSCVNSLLVISVVGDKLAFGKQHKKDISKLLTINVTVMISMNIFMWRCPCHDEFVPLGTLSMDPWNLFLRKSMFPTKIFGLPYITVTNNQLLMLVIGIR